MRLQVSWKTGVQGAETCNCCGRHKISPCEQGQQTNRHLGAVKKDGLSLQSHCSLFGPKPQVFSGCHTKLPSRCSCGKDCCFAQAQDTRVRNVTWPLCPSTRKLPGQTSCMWKTPISFLWGKTQIHNLGVVLPAKPAEQMHSWETTSLAVPNRRYQCSMSVMIFFVKSQLLQGRCAGNVGCCTICSTFSRRSGS